MSTIRGINRITIVLAVIAILPGFIGGWKIYKAERKIEVKVPCEEEEDKSLVSTPEAAKAKIPLGPVTFDPFKQEKHQYRYPPKWECTIGGIAGSCVAFIIVFLGINGMTKVLLWIIAGFKNERKLNK